MGLFDWISRGSAKRALQPQLPLPGSVEAFDGAAGIISVFTEAGTQPDGCEVSFTLDDCRIHANGYQPVQGTPVVVRAVHQQDGRVRATDVLVVRRGSLAAYLESPEALSDENVQWAHDVGIATVLFGVGMDQVTKFLERLRFPEESKLPSMRCVASPFPDAGIDTRAVGKEFSFGQSYFSFGGGLPGGYGVSLRRTTPATGLSAAQLGLVGRDKLAPDESLRNLTLFLAELEEVAVGVILHRAGHRVVDYATWAAAVGDLASPKRRPFEPWIVMCSDERCVFSEGMDLFDLPDVRIDLTAQTALRDRAQAEGLIKDACARMIYENRIVSGETFVGPGGLSYTLRDGGVHVELQPVQ